MSGSGRFWGAVGLVLVSVALALLFGARGRSTGMHHAAVDEAPAMPAPPPKPGTTTAAAPPAVAQSRPGPLPVAAADREMPAQIRRFLEDNVYPPTSRPLTQDSTDLLHPNRRYEKPRPLEDDREMTFVFTADRYYYAGDETALVWLEVSKGGQPAAVDIHRALALAEERGAPTGAAVDLGLQTDGIRWSSALDLERTFPGHHGTILLEVAFQAEGGAIHGEAIRIFTTPLDRVPARLTGEFRDSVREGSLLVEAGVDVIEPGFYRFDANLFDQSGEPVAFTAFKGELAPGEQWVPLEFFGKILRDQGAVGPYTIDQIRGYRFLEGQTPDREQLIDEAVTHRTSPYAPEAFSDEEYTSEHKERMIELMLEDVEEGRTLDLPTLAARPD